MAPNIHETKRIFVTFNNTLCITKILVSKLYFSMCFLWACLNISSQCWRAPSHHQMKNFHTVPSSSTHSCSKPAGSVKIATRRRYWISDWTSHPVCALKQKASYHRKLCYLVWNKCWSMTLQERISQIEMVKCIGSSHVLIILRPTLWKIQGQLLD